MVNVYTQQHILFALHIKIDGSARLVHTTVEIRMNISFILARLVYLLFRTFIDVVNELAPVDS